MDIAERTVQESKAKRLQVGTVIVKNDQIIATGCNGQIAGGSNECENVLPDGSLVTKLTTYHSEMNAVLRVAKSHESTQDASMYTTHACCVNCALLIAGSGIKNFFYKEKYRDEAGLEFLSLSNVIVCQINDQGEPIEWQNGMNVVHAKQNSK